MINPNKVKNTGKRMLIMFIGCLLIASAYNNAYDPSGMVTGGVSGLGIIIRSWTASLLPGGLPLWVSQILLNLPIFGAAYLLRGRSFVMSSMAGTVMMTLALYLVPQVDIAPDDLFMSCIYGAVVSGAGVGLVLRCSASTGGTDMLGMSIAKKLPETNVANIIAAIDGIIVLIGALVFGIYHSLYAVLSVFLASRVTDMILTGQDDARMFYVISDKGHEIAEEIMQTLEHGVSGIRIKGMYTRSERTMLMCVVFRREIVPVKQIIRRHDPKAFVIISSVSDVRGEGFQEEILDD